MPQVFEFIAAKFLQFAISFVRKDRQTDRQTNILNRVVKTSRSATLKGLPRGNYAKLRTGWIKK